MQNKAKKSLGQNFLKSEIALRKIIEAGEIKPEDIILEIGPGKGALTKKLLEHARVVFAVEKDYELMGFLKTKFEKEISEKKLILINEDILEFDVQKNVLSFLNGLAGRARGWNMPMDIFQKNLNKNLKLPNLHYKIIANIPYNITGAILKKFLTEKNQPECMVLMVQHEVATRIVARDGKESILSISVKAYGEPKMVMKVPSRYFSPAPKVDSAIISIKNISRKFFEENNTSPQPSPFKVEGGKTIAQNKILSNQAFEGKFWEIVKAGFAHKRKKLSGNLKKVFLLKEPYLKDLGNKRAEDLALKDWINLVK